MSSWGGLCGSSSQIQGLKAQWNSENAASSPYSPLDLYPDFGFLLTLRGALSRTFYEWNLRFWCGFFFPTAFLRGFPTLCVSSCDLIATFPTQRVSPPLGPDPFIVQSFICFLASTLYSGPFALLQPLLCRALPPPVQPVPSLLWRDYPKFKVSFWSGCVWDWLHMVLSWCRPFSFCLLGPFPTLCCLYLSCWILSWWIHPHLDFI